MPKRVLQGVVVSDKQNKTVVVKVERRYTHPLLKKTVRRTKNYHAHDEAGSFKVGDTVWIARPEGEMGLPEPGRDLLMIAGDTGVVPLKALLTQLAATGDPRSAVLFWGVRNLYELYDIDSITEIARACRRATVVPVISEGEAGPYAAGLVTDAVAAYGEWSGHEVYLAGPPLMLLATSAALQDLGVALEHIHHDRPD